MRLKQLFEPLVWRKGDGCLLSWKAFSWETDIWIMLGNFALKRKIGKGTLHLTKEQFGRNKICFAEDITIILVTCAKKFSDSNFN